MSILASTAARKGERLSRDEANAVRRHLRDILSSSSFATCKRAQDFLRLIVEHALAGEFDSLRERQIGIEMFGRAPDYDTANDAVVRVKATEVRKKLNNFYLETEQESAVRIQLPSGSYVPKFLFDKSIQSAKVLSITLPLDVHGPEPNEPRPNHPSQIQQPETISRESRSNPKPRSWISSRLFVFATFALAPVAILVWLGYVRWHHVAPAQTQAHFAHVRTVNSDAENTYLQGMVRLNEDDAKGAMNFFQKAIALDPKFAEAHSALAACYGWLGETERIPDAVAFSKQRDEALLAIKLDDSLPEGHAELANALMDLSWDWTGAEKEFYRALELSPGSAETHIRYAMLLARTGRGAEAIAEAERARALDPFSSHVFLGAISIYYTTHNYDRAATLLTNARAQGLNLTNEPFFWGIIYAEKSMYAKSISEFRKAGTSDRALGHLGNAYARAGQVDSALKIVETLERQLTPDGTGAYEIALVYAGLGRKDEAFRWLSESLKAHSQALSHLLVDPCLDPLRSDPRFSDLLRQLSLG
jgi:tetratricopeptide (TPR) repeat protein